MKCTSIKTNAWQQALIQAVTDPKELFAYLELDEKLLPAAYQASELFSLKVPRGFMARMQKRNFQDPLLQQVLPHHDETLHVPGYVQNPLQEDRFNPVPGLLHKYHGRVLMTLTGACGINCRYCFRRHFDYQENSPGPGWSQALAYIAENVSIQEVILSGGDPLVLNDHTLKNLFLKLGSIPHIDRVRIHSRMPIVLPERITSEFLEIVTNNPFKIILVTHCNHPQEINNETLATLSTLQKVGVTLLNQTVLLKGVNDNAETLIQLSLDLFTGGILPYYLHVLDKVAGAAHFDIGIERAKQLHTEMTQQLSGYLVPRLVCEQPGAPAKSTIMSPGF